MIDACGSERWYQVAWKERRRSPMDPGRERIMYVRAEDAQLAILIACEDSDVATVHHSLDIQDASYQYALTDETGRLAEEQ